MEIPETLKIGAHTYSVVLEDADGESDSRFGHCYTRKLQIYIDPRVSPSQQEETLLHEAMHAICSQLRAFPSTEAGADDEEKLVQSMGHAIYLLLKENDFLR